MCLLSEQPQLTLTLQSKVLAPQTSLRLKMLELKTSKIKLCPVSHCLFSTHVLSVTRDTAVDHSGVKFGENISACNSYQIRGLGASYLSPSEIQTCSKEVKTKTALLFSFFNSCSSF